MAIAHFWRLTVGLVLVVSMVSGFMGLPECTPATEHNGVSPPFSSRPTWALPVDHVRRSVTLAADSTAPQLSIIVPADGSYVSDGTIYWECSDLNGISKTEIRIDSSAWQVLDKNYTNYVQQWADGPHVVEVRVTDPSGNQATKSVSFTYDNTQPVLVNILPKDSSELRKDNIWFSWEFYDATSGIDHYEIQVDPGRNGSGPLTEVGTNTSYHATGLKDGWHSLMVRAYDRAGNSVAIVVSVKTTSNAWSFGGPYYGLPLVSIVLAIVVVCAVSALMLRRRRGGPTVAAVQRENPPSEMQ